MQPIRLNGGPVPVARSSPRAALVEASTRRWSGGGRACRRALSRIDLRSGRARASDCLRRGMRAPAGQRRVPRSAAGWGRRARGRGVWLVASCAGTTPQRSGTCPRSILGTMSRAPHRSRFCVARARGTRPAPRRRVDPDQRRDAAVKRERRDGALRSDLSEGARPFVSRADRPGVPGRHSKRTPYGPASAVPSRRWGRWVLLGFWVRLGSRGASRGHAGSRARSPAAVTVDGSAFTRVVRPALDRERFGCAGVGFGDTAARVRKVAALAAVAGPRGTKDKPRRRACGRWSTAPRKQEA